MFIVADLVSLRGYIFQNLLLTVTQKQYATVHDPLMYPHQIWDS